MSKHTPARDTDQVPVGFRRLVKAQMEQLGLTLRQVAEQTDLSAAYLCRILQGERGLPPDNDTLLKMGRVLGIDPPELLLVEANRLEPWMKEGVSMMLSATTGKTAKDKAQIIKQVQAFLVRQHAKGRTK